MLTRSERVTIALLGIIAVVCGVVFAWSARKPRQSTESRQLDQVLAVAPTDIEGMDTVLRSIDDPVVRQAALFEWIRRSGASVDATSAASLCERLGAETRLLCLRRLGSPHLRTQPTP